MENLAWVSKNCEMTVYINVEAAKLVFGGGERTEAAGEEAGILTLYGLDSIMAAAGILL